MPESDCLEIPKVAKVLSIFDIAPDRFSEAEFIESLRMTMPTSTMEFLHIIDSIDVILDQFDGPGRSLILPKTMVSSLRKLPDPRTGHRISHVGFSDQKPYPERRIQVCDLVLEQPQNRFGARVAERMPNRSDRRNRKFDSQHLRVLL